MVDGGDQARAFAERDRAAADLGALFNQPPGPLLMTAENQTGWRFEDLASHLADEMWAKTRKFERMLAVEMDPAKAAVVTEARRNNLHIIAALELARTYQLATMRLLDSIGPDQGPSGAPRIGEPIRVQGADAIQAARPATGSADLPHVPV